MINTNPLTGNLIELEVINGRISYRERLKRGEIVQVSTLKNHTGYDAQITVNGSPQVEVTYAETAQGALELLEDALSQTGHHLYDDGSTKFAAPNLDALSHRGVMKIRNLQTGNVALVEIDDDMPVIYTERLRQGEVIRAYLDEDGDVNASLNYGDDYVEAQVFGHSCIDDALSELEDVIMDFEAHKYPDGSTRWYAPQTLDI